MTLSLSLLNPEAKEALLKILEKSPSELSENEILFLRARSPYLKDSQLKEYAEVLEVSEVKEEKGSALKNYFRLLEEAKKLGFTGKNVKRAQLEEFIKSKQ